MTDRSDGRRTPHDRRGAQPPASVDEALARARAHGRAAAVELGAAARALLDAASLAATGAPSDAHVGLRALSRAIEQLVRGFGRDGGPSGSVLDALSDALDAEIARWEARADREPDARAVLRAYLGVREILWEFGVRRTPPAGAGTRSRRPRPAQPAATEPREEAAEPHRASRTTVSFRPRLQRVPVEG